jgi:hypothetical protein
MTYSAEISRANPTLFVFLVDQSGSMGDAVSGGGRRKCDEVADTINRLLQNLAIRSAKEEGVRDYFHVSVIGYGQHGATPTLAGALAGQASAPLSQVADNPTRIEDRTKKVSDGAGGLVDQGVRFPIWLDPMANGSTPMCAAFDKAYEVVAEFLTRHPDCFPPVVLNVSDGESTDGDPTGRALNVASLGSTDGPVLVFNLHVSSTSAAPILFPSSEESLPDQWSKMLFGMSSPLPDHMMNYARSQELAVAHGSRGFVFNSDVTSLVQFFDIGTRVASELR